MKKKHIVRNGVIVMVLFMVWWVLMMLTVVGCTNKYMLDDEKTKDEINLIKNKQDSAYKAMMDEIGKLGTGDNYEDLYSGTVDTMSNYLLIGKNDSLLKKYIDSLKSLPGYERTIQKIYYNKDTLWLVKNNDVKDSSKAGNVDDFDKEWSKFTKNFGVSVLALIAAVVIAFIIIMIINYIANKRTKKG